MSQVSRPVQVLLGVTLLFAIVWFVALRPKSPAVTESAVVPQTTPAQTTPAAPGTEGLTRAIDKAQNAVTTADGDAERAAQSSADGSSSGAGDSSAAATGGAAAGAAASRGTASARSSAGKASARHTAHKAAVAAAHRKAAASSVDTVRSALRHHKAVAIAFVDPNTADARAVARELSHVSHFGGRAVTLSVPLARLSAYSFITNDVQVTVAPTVVIVDPRHSATTIVGYADRGEIEQRLADALGAKRR